MSARVTVYFPKECVVLRGVYVYAHPSASGKTIVDYQREIHGNLSRSILQVTGRFFGGCSYIFKIRFFTRTEEQGRNKQDNGQAGNFAGSGWNFWSFHWCFICAEWSNSQSQVSPFSKLINCVVWLFSTDNTKMPYRMQGDKEGLPNGRNLFPNGRKWSPNEKRSIGRSQRNGSINAPKAETG